MPTQNNLTPRYINMADAGIISGIITGACAISLYLVKQLTESVCKRKMRFSCQRGGPRTCAPPPHPPQGAGSFKDPSCTDGRARGRVDSRTGGRSHRTDVRTDGLTDGRRSDRRSHGRPDRWMVGRSIGRSDGWTGERSVGWKDGRMDGQFPQVT